MTWAVMPVLWPWRYIRNATNHFCLRICVSGVISLLTSLMGCFLEQVKPQLWRSRPAVPSQIISANFADLLVR